MNIENGGKQKPKMKIVHMREDFGRPNKQVDLNFEQIINDINIEIPFKKDLEFCENIESVIKIDEGSRKNILNKLNRMASEWGDITNGQEVGKTKLSVFLRIYNQIYKFETDEERKKEVKEIRDHYEFVLRELLLS